ncbi:MAG: carbohydrate kinase family protein [Candidatus Latescibacterota bacterium]
MPRILAIGQLVVDVVVHPVTHLPQDGEAAIVEPLYFTMGGCALNTAVVLDRLGVTVGLCGLLGSDWGGRCVREMLEGTGVDLSAVKDTKDWSTTSSVVLVEPDGQRSFFHHPGAAAHLTVADIPEAALAAAEVIVVSGLTKLASLDVLALFRHIGKLGKRLVVDVDYEPSGDWQEAFERCLPYIDVFVPSWDEAHTISGEREPAQMVRYFRDRGASWVGIKRSDQGCYLDTGDTVVEVPAIKVPVVDTTGAGDAWVGGFAAGYIWGWKPQEIARLANACGAMAVTSVGATTGIGNLAQARHLMTKI